MLLGIACPLLLIVNIVGYNDMTDMVAKLNALFVGRHPGARFNTQLKGTATAAPALTLGVSDLAPMGAEFSDMELAAYRSYVGADPVAIRVAHCSLNPRALSAPIGIYVNTANPIQNLTSGQVARIFTSGNSDGDITHWGQAGATGEWASRSIHPSGIGEEAAAGLASFMLKRMPGRPFAREYDSFAQSVQVVERVREDPAAIGFASGNITRPGARLVSIDETALDESNVAGGKYPYDRHLLIYIRRVPGEPPNELVKEYLRLALSKAGQAAIASASPYYLPLNEGEIAGELTKIDLAPATRTRTSGKEDAKIALYRLITGKSTYALIDREIWPLEARPFRQNYGYEPAAIRIAHSSAGGIYLHAANPLKTLTRDQITRIFTAGGASGDITHWNQLGWNDRAIHIYGRRDDGEFATAMRHSRMGGLPFARGYEPFATAASAILAVAGDPAGIALRNPDDPRRLPGAVKFVAIGELSSYLTLYVNHAPGKALDGAAQQFARELLSEPGQTKLAREGFAPLTRQEAAIELGKL